MKKTKMFYGNQYLGSVKIDGRLGEKKRGIKHQIFLATRMTQICLTIASVLVLGGWLVTAGILIAKSTIEPTKVYAKEIIEVPIKEIPPVLQRIAKCESPTGHYDENGKVVINKNTDGSLDIGKYQINSVHLAEIARMKLNVYDEKDNETFALHLMDARGTSDWYSSKGCWVK